MDHREKPLRSLRIGVELRVHMVHGRAGHDISRVRGSRCSRSSQVKLNGGGDSALLIHLENLKGRLPCPPELILHNARSPRTGCPRLLKAIAITAGKIAARGRTSRFCAAGARKRNVMTGAKNVSQVSMIPHMHPIRGGLNYNLELRWTVSLRCRCIAHAKRTSCRTPAPQWVRVIRRLDRIPVCRTPDAQRSMRSTQLPQTHPCS